MGLMAWLRKPPFKEDGAEKLTELESEIEVWNAWTDDLYEGYYEEV